MVLGQLRMAEASQVQTEPLDHGFVGTVAESLSDRAVPAQDLRSRWIALFTQRVGSEDLKFWTLNCQKFNGLVSAARASATVVRDRLDQ